MSTENIDSKFEKISFWQLLEKRGVEIPIIQRDYAQGRKSKEKVRNNFLEALKSSLVDGNDPVELDFVFGTEKKENLQPLDGQQRLTTLFLLHWYFASKEEKLDESIKAQLAKFTYETRASSREFCNALVNQNIDFNSLIPFNKESDISIENQLSSTIKNTSWFVISWEKDPTISAMLIMLDAIHSKFNGMNDKWQKLIDIKKPPISFLYLKLENFGLSDDLYIKMNARGKALTDFENFKARFEKHIKENEFEKDLSLTEVNKEQWKELTEKTFSHRIDTVWADLFWKHRGEKFWIIDYEIINFIAGIAINSYAEKKEKNINEERIKQRIQELSNKPIDVCPDDFPNKEAFNYLKKCFDLYAKKNNEGEFINDEIRPEKLPLWNYCDKNESSLFKEFIKDKNKGTEKPYDGTSYKQRVLFYAQTQYLKNVKTFNMESFSYWMRVVRNIVHNATIDNAGAYIGAIGLINKLSDGCEDIYKHLTMASINSGFASNQVKEEIIKAKIIFKNPDAKSVIHKTEDTNICKGKIRFPLYCIDFEIDNSREFDISKLEKVLTIINDNFADLNTKLSDEFKRAFLTIKDNNYYEVWGTWSFSFENNKRWLLNIINDLKNSFFESSDWKRDYLKELVVKLFNKTLNDIIKEYKCPDDMPNWKKRLIKEDKLLNGATFILIPPELNYCKLAWQQKPSKEEQVKKIE